MVKKLFLAVVAIGLILWLAEGHNGKQAGDTGAEMANTGIDATGGALDGLQAFLRGLHKS